MLIVAHRGNYHGPESCNHNLEQIFNLLDQGIHVEIDLWQVKNQHFIGHNSAEQAVELKKLDHPHVIFHLKNLFLPHLRFADAFALHEDPFTLTLKGRMWCNYGIGCCENAIICAPELVGASEPLESFIKKNKNAWAICTDYGNRAKRFFEALM